MPGILSRKRISVTVIPHGRVGPLPLRSWPSQLTYLKSRRRGSLPASKGLAFLRLLALIGTQLLPASRSEATAPPVREGLLCYATKKDHEGLSCEDRP